MHKWKYVSITDPVLFQPTTYWVFDENKAYLTRDDGTTYDTLKFGDYALKNNVLIISGPNTDLGTNQLFMGNFQIMRINNNELILARREDGDGLMYHEFVKAD